MCFLLLLFLSSSGISRIRPSGKRWEKRILPLLLETSISFRNRLSLSLSLFPNLVRPSTSSFLPAFPIYFDLPFVVPPAAHSLILVTSPLPDPTSVLQRFGNFVFFIFFAPSDNPELQLLHAALVYTLFFCASVTVRTIRSAEALKSFQQQRGWNEKEAQREEGHNSIWTCLSLSESLHSFLSAAQERERDAAAAEGRDAATRRIQAESGSALLPVPHAPLDTRRPTLLYRPETGYIYTKRITK